MRALLRAHFPLFVGTSQLGDWPAVEADALQALKLDAKGCCLFFFLSNSVRIAFFLPL